MGHLLDTGTWLPAVRMVVQLGYCLDVLKMNAPSFEIAAVRQPGIKLLFLIYVFKGRIV